MNFLRLAQAIVVLVDVAHEDVLDAFVRQRLPRYSRESWLLLAEPST
jgi:hypothetical protein